MRFFLDAYRALDGRRVWRAPVGTAPGSTMSSPAADPTLVLYPSADGYLYALGARTGKQRWKAQVGVTWSTPAIANGLVWIVDAAARLVAINAHDGRALWHSQPYRFQFDTWTPSPVVAGGYVLLGTYADQLVAYHVPPR
jgi:outer membrane protein assembly factor BamB